MAGSESSSGDLFVVWGGNLEEGVVKATFSMSNDAGRTWSEPITVGDTPAGRDLRSQSFLPAMAVTGDGTVGVLYYDFRFDDEGSETLTDVWLAHCHARSANCADRSSWHGDARLTESSFDLKEMPPNNRRSMPRYFPGDYMGLTATEHDFLAFYVQPHDPASVFFSRIAPADCAGDCDGSGDVRINEVIAGVNIGLETLPLEQCPAADANRDGQVAINEVITAVNNGLSGCFQ